MLKTSIEKVVFATKLKNYRLKFIEAVFHTAFLVCFLQTCLGSNSIW